MRPIDLRDAVITIRDGGSNYVTLVLGEGNLNYSVRRNVEAVDSRGLLDTVREGKQEVVDLNFQFVWTELTASTDDPPTLEDVFYHIGEAADWVSTATDANAPFAVDIRIVLTYPCEDVEDQTIDFTWFSYQELSHSLKDATIDCKGFANMTRPTVTRS